MSKVCRVESVESGFYPWGPIKGYKVFGINFKVSEEEIELSKDEDYESLAKSVFEDFETLVKKSGLKTQYTEALYPDTKYDLSRFLLRGSNLDQDLNVRTQLTFFFNKLSEASIIAYKLHGSQYLHPIKIDIETNKINQSLSNPLVKTPREVQLESYYRKYNIVLLDLDCQALKESMNSKSFDLNAWVELERHGQAFFGFVVKSYEDCEFIQEKFITTNLLNVNAGNVMIRPKGVSGEELEKVCQWIFEKSFRLEPGLNLSESCKVLKD